MTNNEFKLNKFYKEPSCWEIEREENKNEKIYYSDDHWELLYDPNNHDFINEIRMGNYRSLFEQSESILERRPTVFDYHNLYTRISEELFTEIFVYDNEVGGDEIEEVTVADRLNEVEYFQNIDYAYHKEIVKLDIIFDEYATKLEASSDMTIKEFPKNISEKEKDILNHLASKFYIKRNLTPNGLLPLFGKNGTKRLLEELYKCVPEYKDFQAFNFIKSCIETNLPDATLQNYCREVRKDMKK